MSSNEAAEGREEKNAVKFWFLRGCLLLLPLFDLLIKIFIFLLAEFNKNVYHKWESSLTCTVILTIFDIPEIIIAFYWQYSVYVYLYFQMSIIATYRTKKNERIGIMIFSLLFTPFLYCQCTKIEIEF